MTILLMAVEKGSFSAAARELRIPVQTVSRKIAELEERLGTQLLTRSTRSLVLTDAGSAYAEAARQIVEQVEDAERQAAGEFTAPRGELVISAPILFGRLVVQPIACDFLEEFPEINIRLVLGDRNVNLQDDQVDMAVRIGALPDSTMVASRVGSIRGVVCGSPALLARVGTPKEPDDLSGMPCITPDGPDLTAAWQFRDPQSGARFEIAIAPRLMTTAEGAADAAARGVGFSRSLHYQVFDALQDGRLTVVLEHYELEPFPVHLVHAPGRLLPLKMRRFLDFAAPRLRAHLAALNARTVESGT